MPLIKRIQEVVFEAFSYRGTSAKEIREYHGDPFSGWNNKNLQIELEGYPSKDKPAWKSPVDRSGTWFLTNAARELQEVMPVKLSVDGLSDDDDLYFNGGRHPAGDLWLFKGWAYFAVERDLSAEDVRALVNVEVNKRRLAIEKAHALQAMGDNFDKPKRRETIPQAVRVEVWQRDGGRCVECDSQERLEFDHIIPVVMGGANTSRNLQLLCETCNRRKGASLG